MIRGFQNSELSIRGLRFSSGFRILGLTSSSFKAIKTLNSKPIHASS